MQEVFVESFDATKLFFNRELVEDARAAIVIVHGLCEHQGRYDYFAEKLHQAGISTYRFDHRGHGRSEGERTYYSDFNEILDDTNVFVDLAIKENPATPFLSTEPNIRTKNSAVSSSAVHWLRTTAN